MSFGGDTFHNPLHDIDPALRGDNHAATSGPVTNGIDNSQAVDHSFRFGEFLANDDLGATYDAHETGFNKDYFSPNFVDDDLEEMFYGEDEEDFAQLGRDVGVDNMYVLLPIKYTILTYVA